MVSRQMNMNNMRKQAYGVWKPPPHMPLTITNVLKKIPFKFFSPLPIYIFVFIYPPCFL
jgi:hypothetical protein